MNETHQTDLHRLLNERLAMADGPDAVWIDAEDVFAELESRLNTVGLVPDLLDRVDGKVAE